MNIRSKLTIRFTLIVATLAVIFGVAIYYFSSSYRKHEFYERLKEKAVNYARLLIKLDGVHPDLLQVIDKNTIYLANERIIVVDENNKQLFNTYGDLSSVKTDFLNKIRREKEIKYKEKDNEVYAVFYETKIQNLVVIVSALDIEGLNKLKNLKIVLIVGLIIFSIATLILGWIFSRHMLSPISNVISEVEKITASSLTQRVNEGNGKDEIAQLAVTFNRMLDRIQKAFELQKSFVSNSSHELRTPLTSITGQIEVALMSQRKPEEYQAVLNSLLDDIKSVNRLTNGLLELAQADLDISKLKMKNVRIDELLWLTRNDLMKRNIDYKINIEILDFPEDETKLLVFGSEHLLRSVFINLMDNACKFSKDKTVNVQFKTQKEKIYIYFIDHGIGILEDELKKIGQPFYRGSNTKGIAGHGLGLSLVYKIIELHHARINISSNPDKLTQVDLVFNVV